MQAHRILFLVSFLPVPSFDVTANPAGQGLRAVNVTESGLSKTGDGERSQRQRDGHT
jgi:hypothetical protein